MSSIYALVKTVHIVSALLSVGGFSLRGALLLCGSKFPRRYGVRLLSYAIDSVLLASAVALMVLSSQYPFRTPWLTAKVLGVAAYIGLGILAFRLPLSRRLAAIVGSACLLIAAYIASVAVSKDPAGFIFWNLP